MKKNGFFTAFLLLASACGGLGQAHPELPTISTRCDSSEDYVEPGTGNHAVLELQGRTEADLWLEVEVSNEEGERHLLVYFGGPIDSYQDVYHSIGDLRGEAPRRILSSENRYVLRGFRAPYENYPDFRGETPLFEAEFTVPRCDG